RSTASTLAPCAASLSMAFWPRPCAAPVTMKASRTVIESPLSLVGDETAVDRQRDPVDVARLVAREEERGRADLAGAAEALDDLGRLRLCDRGVALGLVRVGALVVLVHHRRSHPARAEAVDPDLGRELERERPRERDRSALGGAVGRLPGD